jgi:hypothetical protein
MLNKFKELALSTVGLLYGFFIYVPYYFIARWLEKKREKREKSIVPYVMTQDDMDEINIKSN